jgi:hypothetical protein
MRTRWFILLGAVWSGVASASVGDLASFERPSVALSASRLSVRTFPNLPNPWRSDRHPGQYVTFDQLTEGTTIRIFSIAAQHVKTLNTQSGTSVQWDLTNESGATVASGIYLYLVTNGAGQQASGKLAVIR